MVNLIIEHRFNELFEAVFNLERLKHSNECNCKSGIYFLFQDDIITYIGITQNFNKRLFNGRTPHIELKEFDSYSLLPINEDNYYLEKLEFILINFFNPLNNHCKRKQLFLNELPKDYNDKNEAKEIKKARENAFEFLKHFQLLK